MTSLHRHLIFLILVTLLILAIPRGSAIQAEEQEPGFPLSAASAYCNPGYMGPFAGCTPWEGVEVTFTSADDSVSTSCITSGTERAASCTVNLPFGATFLASIDPSVIPDGYVLEGDVVQEFQIPDGPPEGEFPIAAYVLLPATEDAPPPISDAPASIVESEDEASDTGPVVASGLPSTGIAPDQSAPVTTLAFTLASLMLMGIAVLLRHTWRA